MDTPFALATVVRTVGATAAKAGAKAVILPDGTISEGWIGGGCARAAVVKAARDAIADGKPRLVCVQPPDALQDQGNAAGKERAGVRFAQNLCPSQGTMDIFVEPVLPLPQLIVCGSSPVAVAVAELGRRLSFATTLCEALSLPADDAAARYLVIATQGRGDEPALKAALEIEAEYVAFVGSHKKADALKAKLAADVAPERLAKLKAPAGLDLGAITPDEIAVSILAEIVAVRRGRQSRDVPAPS
jgi:xanthine dehydrogenase accessory factor